MTDRNTSVLVLSFGYLHALPPIATIVIDVRDALHDPHVNPEMWQLTGLYHSVYEHVLATDGAAGLLDRLEALATRVLELSQDKPVSIAVGCASGRHRSVVLATELGRRLNQAGWVSTVKHLHVDRPVVSRPPASDS